MSLKNFIGEKFQMHRDTQWFILEEYRDQSIGNSTKEIVTESTVV